MSLGGKDWDMYKAVFQMFNLLRNNSSELSALEKENSRKRSWMAVGLKLPWDSKRLACFTIIILRQDIKFWGQNINWRDVYDLVFLLELITERTHRNKIFNRFMGACLIGLLSFDIACLIDLMMKSLVSLELPVLACLTLILSNGHTSLELYHSRVSILERIMASK
ncbi:hypothetical protein CFP56_014399 [Quercus suber]|uniref:Uncharacterized protein n=1 Tax=Quercus suber TaxID=58331 RepID=A0AAW0KTC0_QUESU